MYLLFFLFWVIFNGQLTLEIAIFGIVIAAVMYWFICKFMDFSFQKDLFIFRKMFLILKYIFVLIAEIIKANFATIHMILSSKDVAEPAIVKFRTTLHSKFARVLLANSITLTPGTITVTLQEDEYTVHCLDKSFAEGIDDSVFVHMLERLEEPLEVTKQRKAEAKAHMRELEARNRAKNMTQKGNDENE